MSATPDSPPLERAAWLRMSERGSGRLLHWYARVSRRMGRRRSRWLLAPISAYYVLFAPAARRESKRYLRLALAREPTLADVWRHFHCFATTIHDRVFLARGELGELQVELEGAEALNAASEAGRGALLMGAHVGSFEVVNAVGRLQAGVPVAMAMYEENARKMRALSDALEPISPPRIVALGRLDAMLQIRDLLDAGVFVGVLADRTLGAEPVQTVNLLGQPAEVPTGPMRAAALLRRPVLFMSGAYLGAGRYRVSITPLADFTATSAAERDRAVASAIEAYAQRLTALCREAPYNWFNFFPFWRS
ncbi:MAG: acyl-CoA synthetase [Steroidobacteraceae bacterium]